MATKWKQARPLGIIARWLMKNWRHLKSGIKFWPGALQYTADLQEIRQNLLPDFRPSSFVASSLMDAFLTNQSAAEALLSGIILDDYYCGRDLVA